MFRASPLGLEGFGFCGFYGFRLEISSADSQDWDICGLALQSGFKSAMLDGQNANLPAKTNR